MKLSTACIALMGCLIWFAKAPVRAAEQRPALSNPDAVCASCHQAIYERYEKTSMARGSGLAAEGMIPGGFHHAASGVDYKVFARDGDWMSYSREATTAEGALSGERRLEYFIGSGHRGRTFLYQTDGQWFELPINFYTRRQVWDMAPAFDNATSMPAPLPVDPNCLHCHATGVQTALPTARNRYAHGPFAQGGVGCSACHGDPAAHLAQHGLGAIVNPAKLSPSRRDSACIQCHLEGDAVVYRPGKSLAQFQAGDELADYAVYFVRAQQAGEGRRATSQYEALLRSACKRATGDKLTCTTCHDPHGDPAPSERVAYFRAKCLTCHTGAAMATHHVEQQDCATCHMPSRSTTDISHEQVTDHDIEAVPAKAKPSARSGELVPVGGFPSDDRTLGIAYAQMAQRGDQAAGRTALTLLTMAALAGEHDPELLVRLGFLQQVSGDVVAARASYTAVLESDPYEPAALANLAVMDAGAGRTSEAVRLLERLTDNDPSQTAAGLNLMFIDCKLGRSKEALDLSQRLLNENPDNQPLRTYLRTGDYAGERCALRTTGPVH
jgi:predicted CXXCH cytochrome family protein